MKTAAAVAEDVPVNVSAIGTVQALRSVPVRSQVDGVIAQIHFREGEEVDAGALLVTLDQRPFKNLLQIALAELANARAILTQAQADVDRSTPLQRASVISQDQHSQVLTKLEIAKALVTSKEAAVANADLQLSYTEIRAPIAGRTGQRNLHEGALVRVADASQFLVVINQLSPVAVTYSVPESTLASVRAANASGPIVVRVTHTSGEKARPVEGRLDFVNNTVDPTTGTIVLKALFQNDDRALWPGQFVSVSTLLGVDAKAVLVPAAAIQTGQRGSQVFVLKPDNTVELRPVPLGRSWEGKTIVLSGLAAGETVVVDGQLRLLPGSQVEVRPVEQKGKSVPATGGAKAAAAKKS